MERYFGWQITFHSKLMLPFLNFSSKKLFWVGDHSLLMMIRLGCFINHTIFFLKYLHKQITGLCNKFIISSKMYRVTLNVGFSSFVGNYYLKSKNNFPFKNITSTFDQKSIYNIFVLTLQGYIPQVLFGADV